MAAIGPRLVSPEDGDISGSPSLLQRPGSDTEVECTVELIQRIRAETVDALLRLPHGGLEIAGVLFGTKRGHTLQVCGSRAIDCEHARGPSLTLSSRDEQELERLLTEARHDPELAGLEAVGWFVSHTRRPFALADSDAAVFDKFFPQPMQLTAVVRPEASGSAHFRLYARNDDGLFDAQLPSLEFSALPEAPKLKSETPNPPEPRSPGKELVAAGIQNQRWLAPNERLREVRTVRQVRISNFSLIAAGLILLLLIAGCALWWFEMQPEVERTLPLRVTDSGQQLRIDWDASAPMVQRARSGVLEIKDLGGGLSPVRIKLGPEILNSGSVLYSKPSDKVSIRLQLVDDNQRVSESMVYFLAREQPAPKVEDAPKPAPEPAPEPVAVETRPRPEPTTDTRSARTTPSKIFSTPPVRASSAPAPESAVIEAPKIPITPAQTAVAPLVGSLHSALAPPPPVVVESPKTETPKARPAPTSGRLIWTGELRKGTLLKVTSRGASTGALNGTLPAGPIKVSVHSAELLDGAIAIYTSNPNARQSAEAPSRRNGWNVTMYQWDPKRANDVVVVEPPAPGADWKQIVLKSVNRTTSIIVIDWQQTGN